MGMNLYLKRVPTQADKRRMIDLVNSERYRDLKTYIDICAHTLHLCKLSYGWQAIFDLNGGEYYEPTRESIINFCVENGYEVIGGEYPMNIHEAFEYIDNHNTDPKNVTTQRTYYSDNNNVPTFFNDYIDENVQKHLDKFGIKDVKFSCFEHDGLVFDTQTDWE